MANTNQIRLKLDGFEDLRLTLLKLPLQLQKRAEVAVLRAGGVPIRKAAKRFAAASKDSGLLMKSIGLNVKKVKGVYTVRVGPRKGFRQIVTRKNKVTGKNYEDAADPTNYAHLVEGGTSHSAAKPFMRPAIDSAQGEVIEAMGKGLEKHLDRLVKNMFKK